MKLSIIVPVYQEKNIKVFLNALKSIDNISDCEIIVEIGKGRARQMNAGAKKAQGNILLFLHADSILPQNAVNKILEILDKPEIVAGAFTLSFGPMNSALRLLAFCANLRVRITRIPFGDQGIFIKKSYFNKLGGYKDIPLMEDLELMKRIRRNNKKIVILKEKVITSARRWQEKGIVLNTIQNNWLQFLYFIGVSPAKLAQIYYGKD
ncbi:TIGR04283 family arsenosugar biosynthesis glycosyltransferase [Candidatus Margulisiibacteriota bacterium]